LNGGFSDLNSALSVIAMTPSVMSPSQKEEETQSLIEQLEEARKAGKTEVVISVGPRMTSSTTFVNGTPIGDPVVFTGGKVFEMKNSPTLGAVLSGTSRVLVNLHPYTYSHPSHNLQPTAMRYIEDGQTELPYTRHTLGMYDPNSFVHIHQSVFSIRSKMANATDHISNTVKAFNDLKSENEKLVQTTNAKMFFAASTDPAHMSRAESVCIGPLPEVLKFAHCTEAMWMNALGSAADFGLFMSTVNLPNERGVMQEYRVVSLLGFLLMLSAKHPYAHHQMGKRTKGEMPCVVLPLERNQEILLLFSWMECISVITQQDIIRNETGGNTAALNNRIAQLEAALDREEKKNARLMANTADLANVQEIKHRKHMAIVTGLTTLDPENITVKAIANLIRTQAEQLDPADAKAIQQYVAKTKSDRMAFLTMKRAGAAAGAGSSAAAAAGAGRTAVPQTPAAQSPYHALPASSGLGNGRPSQPVPAVKVENKSASPSAAMHEEDL